MNRMSEIQGTIATFTIDRIAYSPSPPIVFAVVDFDGGGRTQRASRLLTTLTVTVQEVLDSGLLRVAGTQSLTVNDELQRVTLEGLVRPLDVTDGNVVLSTRIAQARITYVGEGDLTERGRRAWWRKLLDALGL